MNLRGIVSLFALAVGLCAQPSSTCPTDSTVLGNIVNTATGASENYAGYTFLTISGLNMQTGSRSASPVPPGGTLPTTMGGVTVLVNAAATYLLSFTPQQILVLLPRLQPGCLTLLVEANGTIQLQTQFYANATAPGLFTYADGQTVIASHTDWSLVTATARAFRRMDFAVGRGIGADQS